MATEFKVDVSRGSLDGRVSSQWASRPDDQRFLSLEALERHVTKRSEKLVETTAMSDKVRMVNEGTDLILQVEDKRILPTHAAFGQLCAYIGSPASYLRRLPASLAAECINNDIANHAPESLKFYHGPKQMVGVTGPNFGRVMDATVVRAVRQLAGNGVGDTHWKIPGTINWAKGTYNPYVDINKDTTTLYASDRDVFMFLVDDTRPISVGKLPDGNDDLVFRGFYCWNSEIGGITLGISTFLLRGVCQNRNLWGVEEQQTLAIRHTRGAPLRFDQTFAPMLNKYAASAAKPIQDKANAAKKLVVAKTDEERVEFLRKVGLNKAQAISAIKRGIEEENAPPSTIWDMTQAVSALARSQTMSDARIDLEKKAGALMNKVVA